MACSRSPPWRTGCGGDGVGFGRWAIGAAITAGQVSSGLISAEDMGRRAVQGTRGVARGASGIHRIGVSSRRALATDSDPATVGTDTHHSGDDRERAVAVLDVAFAQFRADVEPRVDAVGSPPTRAQWWHAEVLPALADWALFRDHESSSWISRIATEWSTYEAWLTLIRVLRSGARAQGILLDSPEPDRLPETIFQRGALGRGSGVEAAWTIGRVLLYTAIGVAGAASLVSVVRDLRQKTDEEPA